MVAYRQTLQIQSQKKWSSGCSLLSVWTVHSSKNYSYPHKKTKQRKTPHVDPLHQVCQDILGHEVHSAHARHYSVHRMVTGDNSNRVSDAGCFVSQWKWMNCLQIQVITNIWKGTVLQEELICPHKSVAARFLAFPNLKASWTSAWTHRLEGWRRGYRWLTSSKWASVC